MTKPKQNNNKQYGKVAVLFGGTSAERDISLLSGEAVLQALLRQGVDAFSIDMGRETIQQLFEIHYDRAFIMLHGRGGEDGTIQGLLEILGKPYTGSGVLGSSIAMNKQKTKEIWKGIGLPTPEFIMIHHQRDLERVSQSLEWPVMIKPVNEGSSIGMSCVHSDQELEIAWQNASRYDSAVMAEQWITGDEYTAAIVGDAVLPLIKLQTPHVFYDYDAKYQSDQTKYLCPCGLDSVQEEALQMMVMKAYESVEASGWGRVDFMIDQNGRAWLIEVNTVPGMTDHSLVPMAAKVKGLGFDRLVMNILKSSLKET